MSRDSNLSGPPAIARPDRRVLAALLIAVAAIGIGALAKAVDDLGRVRTAMAGATAVEAVRRMPLSVAPDRAVASADAAVAIVRQAAIRAGLLLETLAQVPADAPQVRLRLVASGSGAAVLRLAESIEGGRPLLRFAGWRVVRTAGGAMRLSATVVAVRR